MPKDALADVILDLDQLLGAVDSHEALDDPYLRRLRDELEAALLEIKALHAEQASLAARRQEVTQRLRITRGQGQDTAIRLRSALRAHFGHRFEGLVRFRIRPVRRRSRAIPESAAGQRPPRARAMTALVRGSDCPRKGNGCPDEGNGWPS
jgi:hypothetical protein